MIVLGIETSCDETAIAVVEDGSRILSNIISSQVELHARYGGIVPEVASRQHVLQVVPVLDRTLAEAGCTIGDLDAVAVTQGPGLGGSLVVGINLAKALAFSLKVPLIGIHHLEGHIYAAWLGGEDPSQTPGFPLVCLIASGGHTELILMRGHWDYQILGRTRDDAAGEAFDKAARILGLGFPGGPAIQKVAASVSGCESLPRAWLEDSLDFSFSGVKTALLHRAQQEGIYPPPTDGTLPKSVVAALAGVFQDAVVDVLATKSIKAVERFGARGLLLGGGVAANALLRDVVGRQCPVPVLIPKPVLCTDNGAMIAAAAYLRLASGEQHDLGIDLSPSLRLA